jgi:hypothetical protein
MQCSLGSGQGQLTLRTVAAHVSGVASLAHLLHTCATSCETAHAESDIPQSEYEKGAPHPRTRIPLSVFPGEFNVTVCLDVLKSHGVKVQCFAIFHFLLIFQPSHQTTSQITATPFSQPNEITDDHALVAPCCYFCEINELVPQMK